MTPIAAPHPIARNGQGAAISLDEVKFPVEEACAATSLGANRNRDARGGGLFVGVARSAFWKASCQQPFVFCSLFFVLCSLFFVLCSLFFVLCSLFFVLCSLEKSEVFQLFNVERVIVASIFYQTESLRIFLFICFSRLRFFKEISLRRLQSN
jgi:hypothetical protein